MVETAPRSNPLVELESSYHPLCALSSAVSLIAGRRVRIPKRAYPSRSPSKFARLLQVGNGARGLILYSLRQSILVSGEKLAYREGEVEYFSEHIIRKWWSFSGLRRPFFVLAGSEPASAIAAFIGCDSWPAPRLFISKFQCTVTIKANWDGIPAIIHYAPCPDSISELDRKAQSDGILAFDPQIEHLLARRLAYQTHPNGATILARTQIPADPHQFNWKRIDAATELWLSRKPLGNNGATVCLDSRTRSVCDYFVQYRELLLPVADALTRWCQSARIPAQVAHGDFWLGNVLFRGNEVTGVIDWEWTHKEGILLADALHMLLRSRSMELGTSFANDLRRFWADEIHESALSSRIARVGSQWGMDSDDMKFIALLLWFEVLRQRAIRGFVESASWLEDMIPRTVPAIMNWLNRRLSIRIAS